MGTTSVPVCLIDRDGNIGADFVNCSPCISLVLIDPISRLTAKVFALIDTGADGIYVDTGIVQKIQARTVAEEVAYGATKLCKSPPDVPPHLYDVWRKSPVNGENGQEGSCRPTTRWATRQRFRERVKSAL